MPLPLIIFLYTDIKIIEEWKLQLKKEKEKNASCRDKDKREIINVCGVISMAFLWLVGLIRDSKRKN
jgi:hypothetical protein